MTPIASRYRVIRELGRGGMGVVYVVEHVHTGEQLALKLLHGAAASDPGALSRFKREARASAKIRSEHVVRVTDADVAPELGGAPFLVMELLDGTDLDRWLDQVGPLSPATVLAILTQLARALDKAHAIGIVHRDLKPANVFLHRLENGDIVVKVLDFGISKFLSTEDSSRSMEATSDGTLLGTPYYMAPEQARGLIDQVGPATDIWAVGLMALRLLTAKSYWTARTNAELMVQILVEPMPPPSARWPQLGNELDAWFARSCHRDPSARWRSVTEQVAALTVALRDGLPKHATAAPLIAPLSPLATALDNSRKTFATPAAGDIGIIGSDSPIDRTVSVAMSPAELSALQSAWRNRPTARTTTSVTVTRTADVPVRRGRSAVGAVVLVAVLLLGTLTYRFLLPRAVVGATSIANVAPSASALPLGVNPPIVAGSPALLLPAAGVAENDQPIETATSAPSVNPVPRIPDTPPTTRATGAVPGQSPTVTRPPRAVPTSTAQFVKPHFVAAHDRAAP